MTPPTSPKSENSQTESQRNYMPYRSAGGASTGAFATPKVNHYVPSTPVRISSFVPKATDHDRLVLEKVRSASFGKGETKEIKENDHSENLHQDENIKDNQGLEENHNQESCDECVQKQQFEIESERSETEVPIEIGKENNSTDGDDEDLKVTDVQYASKLEASCSTTECSSKGQTLALGQSSNSDEVEKNVDMMRPDGDNKNNTMEQSLSSTMSKPLEDSVDIGHVELLETNESGVDESTKSLKQSESFESNETNAEESPLQLKMDKGECSIQEYQDESKIDEESQHGLGAMRSPWATRQETSNSFGSDSYPPNSDDDYGNHKQNLMESPESLRKDEQAQNGSEAPWEKYLEGSSEDPLLLEQDMHSVGSKSYVSSLSNQSCRTNASVSTCASAQTPTLEHLEYLARNSTAAFVTSFVPKSQQKEEQQNRVNTSNIRLTLQELKDDYGCKTRRDAMKLALEQSNNLDLAANLLVDLLFEYENKIGAAGNSNQLFPDIPARNNSEVCAHNGLSLPASALGWLSCYLCPEEEDRVYDERCLNPDTEYGLPNMSPAPRLRDKLSRLKDVLKNHVKYLRVTNDHWPAKLKKKKMESRSQNSTFETPRRRGKILLNFDPDSISLFLRFYKRLQNNPRIDMRLFGSLKYVKFDGVNSNWVQNLCSPCKEISQFTFHRGQMQNLSELFTSSKVVNSTKSDGGLDSPFNDIFNKHIYDDVIIDENAPMTPLLTENHSSRSPLQSPISDLFGVSKTLEEMKHLTLSSCNLEDDILLEPNRQDMDRNNFLARFRSLVTLDLSCNNLQDPNTVLEGLANAPNLTAIDLSFNRFKSMHEANLMLGNIKVLLLSNNHLTNVAGIDHLYALERLDLRNNLIANVSDVSTLGRLPNLMKLDLKGNPVMSKGKKHCRAYILNFFRESRATNPSDTFRDVINALPTLDGKVVSKREIVRLRYLAFSQSIARDEGLSNNNADVESLVENPTFPVIESPQPTCMLSDRRQVTRKVHRKAAQICLITNNDEPKPKISKVTIKRGKPTIAPYHANIYMSLENVIESVSEDKNLITQEEEKEQISEPQISSEEPSVDNSSFDSSSVQSSEIFSEEEAEEIGEPGEIVDDNEEHKLFEDPDESCVNTSSEDNILASALQSLGHKIANSDTESSYHDGDAYNSSHGSEQNRSEDDSKTLENVREEKMMEPSVEGEELKVTPDNDVDEASLCPTEVIQNTDNTEENDTEAYEKSKECIDLVHDTSATNANKGSNDESKVAPSYSSPKRLNFAQMEQNDEYDGPEAYSDLLISEYYDLYFRSFIFPTTLQNESVDAFEEKDQMHKVPKVQLYQSDRDLMIWTMSTKKEKDEISPALKGLDNEKFISIQKEWILPCGLASTVRIPPKSTEVIGPKGAFMFNNGTPHSISECQQLLFCISNKSVYILPDFSLGDSSTRRFPSGIPSDATFTSGAWPHAYVRHPLKYLRKITFDGFGFQRLTLSFKLPSLRGAVYAQPENGLMSAYDYTYVLFTGNQKETIKKLQTLQEVAKEAVGSLASEIVIENDNKRTVDAISRALAKKNFSDDILHYEIVSQRFVHESNNRDARRSLVLTNREIILFTETYVGDYSECSLEEDVMITHYGDVSMRTIGCYNLDDISDVSFDKKDATLVCVTFKSHSRLSWSHSSWLLKCQSIGNAEHLISDVRRAISSSHNEE